MPALLAQRRQAPEGGQEVGRKWLDLLYVVHAEHPDCTMYGVNVLNGNIVSCARIQRHMRFGLEPAKDASYLFDRTWEALGTMCRKIGTGRIEEIEFSEGRPINVRVNARRRRRF
ncbi:MAG: hypothetical protein KGJ84_02050 [Elusimicrobia bacterium]|nr:hypothetical protein [Elusimicrobiota bacterium]